MTTGGTAFEGARGVGITDLLDAGRIDGGGLLQSEVVREGHRLYELLIGLWAPGVIEAAVDLGVFTSLAEGPLTAAQLAERLGFAPRATRILLDALHAYDVLDRQVLQHGIWYELPRWVEECFRPGGLFSLAGKIAFDRMMGWDAWHNLARAVREDGAPEKTGASVSDVEFESLVGGINFMAPPIVAALAQALRGHGWTAHTRRVLLDVGCGSGIYSQLLLNEFPQLSAVGIDLPKITPLAAEQSRRLGVHDRCELRPGDFMAQDWGEGYDLVLCANVFHLQSKASARALCRRAARALAPDGVVAIIDQIVDETAAPGTSQDRFARLFAASMLAIGGGDTYQVSEYDQWLDAAGLQRIRLIDTPLHRILLATGTDPVHRSPGTEDDRP